MDVIGGKYNFVKKDNDFIYYEVVLVLDIFQFVKGVFLVKFLLVNFIDLVVIGFDIFVKLVFMVVYEVLLLYSEEKVKLFWEMMVKIEDKNEVLDQFMDLMQLDFEMVDNFDVYSYILFQFMEKCVVFSVWFDIVRNFVQFM